MPSIQLFVLNSFHKEYQCPLFNVPTVSLPMSDRPIQAMPTPTILNNYNAVSHHTDGDVWHAGRQKAGFTFTGAAIGVVVGGVLVVVSQYCFEKYYSNAEQYVCLDCQQHLHG
jgi:hypothetical protein